MTLIIHWPITAATNFFTIYFLFPYMVKFFYRLQICTQSLHPYHQRLLYLLLIDQHKVGSPYLTARNWGQRDAFVWHFSVHFNELICFVFSSYSRWISWSRDFKFACDFSHLYFHCSSQYKRWERYFRLNISNHDFHLCECLCT